MCILDDEEIEKKWVSSCYGLPPPFIVRSLMPLRGRLSREPQRHRLRCFCFVVVPGVALRGLYYYQGCRLVATLWPLLNYYTPPAPLSFLLLPPPRRTTMRMSTKCRTCTTSIENYFLSMPLLRFFFERNSSSILLLNYILLWVVLIVSNTSWYTDMALNWCVPKKDI